MFDNVQSDWLYCKVRINNKNNNKLYFIGKKQMVRITQGHIKYLDNNKDKKGHIKLVYYTW